MEISGLGNSSYISPYGSEGLKQQIQNVNSENKQDSFIKRHKQKDNTASIIGSVLLTAATALGIYKNKGRIGTTFNRAKELAGSAFEQLKNTPIKETVTNYAQKGFNAVKDGVTFVKSKLPSISMPQALKFAPKNIGNAFNTFISKFHK